MSDTTTSDSPTSTPPEPKASEATTSDSGSDSASTDPERQKRVTSDYRNGWDSIWGSKKKKKR